MRQKNIPDNYRVCRKLKSILTTGMLVIVMLFFISFPAHGEENASRTWLKLKTDKNNPNVNISTKTEETVDYDYSVPSGVTVKDVRALEGSATTGDFTITGKKVKESELKFSGKGGAAENITNELNIRKRLNTSTMLRASFRERRMDVNSFREYLTFEAEHKTGDRGPTLIVSGTREDRSTDDSIRNSYRARLTQRLGSFGVMELSGGEDFVDETKKTNIGARVTKKLSNSMQLRVSRNAEFNILDQRKDRTSVDLTSGLGTSAKVRAGYQLIEDNTKLVNEDRINLTYEQEIFDNRMKLIAGYEIRRRDTEIQKTSIGFQRETSVGNFTIKYIKETGNRSWTGAENGIFMGITSRF
jgi:hypothetical protein